MEVKVPGDCDWCLIGVDDGGFVGGFARMVFAGSSLIGWVVTAVDQHGRDAELLVRESIVLTIERCTKEEAMRFGCKSLRNADIENSESE